MSGCVGSVANVVAVVAVVDGVVADSGATAGVSSEPEEHDTNVRTPTTPMTSESRGERIWATCTHNWWWLRRGTAAG